MNDIGVFEQMVELGKDNALLRFTLGSAFLKQERYDEAVEHLLKAVEFTPDYTAAWKILGKAYLGNQALIEAKKTFEKGITIAEQKGDMQAKKEMMVFLKRCEKSSDKG